MEKTEKKSFKKEQWSGQAPHSKRKGGRTNVAIPELSQGQNKNELVAVIGNLSKNPFSTGGHGTREPAGEGTCLRYVS